MSTATLEKPSETKVHPTGAKKYKFKLLCGQYVHTEHVMEEDGLGNKTRRDVNTIYQADRKRGVFPIIETDINLEDCNGRATNMKKFERIHGESPVTITDPTVRLPGETIHAYLARMSDLGKTMKERVTAILKSLDGMDQLQLAKLAEQEEIDITSAKTDRKSVV